MSFPNWDEENWADTDLGGISLAELDAAREKMDALDDAEFERLLVALRKITADNSKRKQRAATALFVLKVAKGLLT